MQILTQNVFQEVRQPGDIDLVEQITAMLVREGHPNPTAWHNHPNIVQAKQAAPKLQRFLINRYWRMRLGQCESSTVAERFCLIEDGTDKEWLSLFDSGVLPAIVNYVL